MKLRYVIPLMLAAATGGGAVVHFRTDIEERIREYRERDLPPARKAALEDRRYADAVEENYRKIADGIVFQCAYEWKEWSIFEQAQETEARWKREAAKLESQAGVRRLGPRLTIKTAKGEVHLDDSGYFCWGSKAGSSYEYIELLPRSGFHFLIAHQYEWEAGVLISAKTGKRYDTELQVDESPDGKRLAAANPPDVDWGGHDGRGIYRVEGDELVREYPVINPDPYAPDPSDKIVVERFVGWIDDTKLLVTLAGREGQHVIVFRDGKWRLERVESK